MEEMRQRAARSLRQLPIHLRSQGEKPPYPVRLSEGLRASAARGEEAVE
jgi:hypothetical protein